MTQKLTVYLPDRCKANFEEKVKIKSKIPKKVCRNFVVARADLNILGKRAEIGLFEIDTELKKDPVKKVPGVNYIVTTTIDTLNFNTNSNKPNNTLHANIYLPQQTYLLILHK